MDTEYGLYIGQYYYNNVKCLKSENGIVIM